MLNNPRVTFVVTSFNYENYIEKTLESIKNQTYDNFEIIVVDDCSSDNSVKIIQEFISKNPDLKIKLIIHNENKGQLGAYLTGLEAAEGVFVSFIDSDDAIVKDFTKTHLRVHLASSVAFTSAQIIEIDENDEIHTTYSTSSPQKVNAYNAKNLDEILDIDVDKVEFDILDCCKAPFGGWFWSPSSSAMFRKSAIEVLLNYKDLGEWKICPDKFVFNFANLIGGSAVIYAPLTAYRRHGKNAGMSGCICGNKRFNNDKTTKINFENNRKIRICTIKFIMQNRKIFYEKFGRRNTAKLILTVLLSHFYIIKQVFS